jgi:outer membrane protein OmpA-like peptidoglycan-associated protein
LKLITIFILCIPIQLISQNLVRNPSFEKTKKCADSISLFKTIVERWSTPTLGTADLFNPCNGFKVGVPNNFNGHQVSKFGKNYAGCYFYAKSNYREYIQGSFKSSLKKGAKYKVSFYISLAEKSDFAMKEIDFLLTKNVISSAIWTELSPSHLKNQLTKSFSANSVKSKKEYNDSKNWILISKVITAKGGENFITIGNFQKNSSTKKGSVSKEEKNKISYYYIDMVSVELIDKPLSNLTKTIQLVEEKETEITKTNKIELNVKYEFQNINFTFNSIKLSQAAEIEINVLYKYLNSNKNTKIIILGHTDHIGSTDYNKVLSEERAKSVADYLIKTGLNKIRIQSLGYGNSQPLSTSKTDKARKKNRRVEFKITKLNN